MITSEELLELLTIEDITYLLIEAGSKEPKKDINGNLYFTTICHCGDSQKLHFYTDTKFFQCYTECGTLSIYDVLIGAYNWDFRAAFNYILKYKNIQQNKRPVGLQKKPSTVVEEIEFLDRHLYTPSFKDVVLPRYNPSVLNVFDNYCPSGWVEEGIKEEVMQEFGIKFYFNQMKAIIPHYDIEGNLVGIKGRNFLQSEIDMGKKYIPITIQGLTYRYPVNFNLYGLYQNKKAIREQKTAILYEGEKSVYKQGSYYEQENNIGLAVQGMNVSLYQRDLLVNQGVNSITIAFDKQYLTEYIGEEFKGTPQHKEYTSYMKKILKVASLFINYCNVYVILSWEDELDYKDSPIDKGKETFTHLYKNRYLIEDLEQIRELID